MKTFKFLLVTVTSFLFFFSQSTLAVYDVDDVPNDTGEKTTTSNTEVEVNEFVLLDAMPDIELYYYPYSASDADAANGEDVPGGAGSTYVGGGVIKWHANVDTTISIDDFTLTHTDSNVTERNQVPDAQLYVNLDTSNVVNEYNAVAALTFDSAWGSTVAAMSSDMTTAYNNRGYDVSSASYSSDNGYTDFATKYYIAISLAQAGSVQKAGTYQASATIRALPTVSN